MIKNCFLLFTIVFLSTAAHAREFSLRYDEYVHLSDIQKDQVVIQIMEFVVELESNYEYDVKKYGVNSSKAQRAKQLLTRVASFLSISSAYAAPPASSWKKYADDFKSLLQDTKEADCVFAGWPSKTYKLGTRTICSHPSKSSSAKVNGKYPKPSASSQCGKAGTLKIQCNPALFGFQDMKSKSLFCVDSSNGAQNSAYHCMKAALGDSNAQERLRMLRDNLNSHPEIFEALQKYVYELCVCKATPEGFSKPYHERIRPHRTCYGMMNMLGEISCGIESSLLEDTSIFKELKSTISLSAKQGEIDQLYTDFLKKIPSTAPEEYARMCPRDSGISIAGGQSAGANGGNPGGITSGNPNGTPSDEDGEGADASGDDKYSCVQATCEPTKEEDKTKPQFSCSFNIKDNTTDEKVEFDADPALTYTPPENAEQESVVVSGFINKEEQEFTCSTGAKDDGGKKVKSDPEDLPTLKLEIKDKGPTKYNINAVTGNDKGWVLKWTIDAPKAVKVSKGWKEIKPKKEEDKDKSPKGMAGDSEEKVEDEKKDDEKIEEPKVDTKPAAGDSKTAIQDRLTTDYKVCAQLHRGKEQFPKSPDCIKVDRLPLKGGMQAPPQGPPRPPNDFLIRGF